MFDEELECEKPFLAQTTMTVSEIGATFDSYSNVVSPDILIICSGNQIEVQFVQNKLPWRLFDQLYGHTYSLQLSNVQDNAGNIMQNYTYSSQFSCHPPNPEIVVTHPAGGERHYLPDVPMIFEATITNNQTAELWTRSYLVIGVDATTNTADLTVLANGGKLGTVTVQMQDLITAQHSNSFLYYLMSKNPLPYHKSTH